MLHRYFIPLPSYIWSEISCLFYIMIVYADLIARGRYFWSILNAFELAEMALVKQREPHTKTTPFHTSWKMIHDEKIIIYPYLM